MKAETLAKAMEFTFIGINSKLTCSHTNMKANRLRPPVSWYKLNWDGSSLGNPGLAGGGLIWNDNGDWVKGYARAIAVSVTTSVVVELWPLGGGPIQNDSGDWVKGYAKAIGVTTSVVAELWPLRDGIRLFRISLRDIPTVRIQH